MLSWHFSVEIFTGLKCLLLASFANGATYPFLATVKTPTQRISQFEYNSSDDDDGDDDATGERALGSTAKTPNSSAHLHEHPSPREGDAAAKNGADVSVEAPPGSVGDAKARAPLHRAPIAASASSALALGQFDSSDDEEDSSSDGLTPR